MRRTIHALALVLAAAWMPRTLQAAAPPAPPVAAADIAAGKSLFDRWCAEWPAARHLANGACQEGDFLQTFWPAL